MERNQNQKTQNLSILYIPVIINTVVSGEWENKPFIGWEVIAARFHHLGDDNFHSNNTITGNIAPSECYYFFV